MRNNSRVFVSAFALVGMLLAAGAFWSCRAQADSKVGVSGNFTEIEMHTGIAVTYVQGPYKPVQIKGDKEKVALVEVSRDGSTLEIRYKSRNRHNNFNSGNVMVIVQAPDVRDFDLSVGASLSIEGAYVSRGSVSFDIGTGAVVNATSVSAGKLEIDCSTGAVANISGIKADKVELDCSTGAVANLGGRANYFSVDCSTGAVVDASRLEAGTGKVEAGTGAQVDVRIRNLKSVEKGHGASVTNHAH